MGEKEKVMLCAHAQVAGLHGGGITVDPELEQDAEELVEEGWLRPAEGTEDEVGYVITEEGKSALALAEAGGLSWN